MRHGLCMCAIQRVNGQDKVLKCLWTGHGSWCNGFCLFFYAQQFLMCRQLVCCLVLGGPLVCFKSPVPVKSYGRGHIPVGMTSSCKGANIIKESTVNRELNYIYFMNGFRWRLCLLIIKDFEMKDLETCLLHWLPVMWLIVILTVVCPRQGLSDFKRLFWSPADLVW